MTLLQASNIGQTFRLSKDSPQLSIVTRLASLQSESEPNQPSIVLHWGSDDTPRSFRSHALDYCTFDDHLRSLGMGGVLAFRMRRNSGMCISIRNHGCSQPDVKTRG